MNSAIYEGTVRHRRFAPAAHAFSYSVFMMYLDLAELDDAFRGRWLWSASRPAPAWLKREDHLGDPSVPLDQAVRDLVAERAGRRPGGPIRLLTHLRTFGYCFNPVSFFYCFDPAGRRVETIVAEVRNTPWLERHCYVLHQGANEGTQERQRYRFRKAFHVSPFMSMDVDYDWRFTEPGRRLLVHMDNRKGGERFFDATMALERRPLGGASLAGVLLRHPFMTWKVTSAIYWQALRLWWKRCPFYPHPAKRGAA